MIKNFGDKETERFAATGRAPNSWRNIANRVSRRLQILDAAAKIEDLYFPPSNRFERLGGKFEDKYSIRIDQRWRLIFGWDTEANDSVDVVVSDHYK